MTEKIGIFVADDDANFRQSLHDWFESPFVPTRYAIPLEAGTVDEALAYIPALKANKIKAALIDDMFGNEIGAGLQITQAITNSGLAIAMLSCATAPPKYLNIHVGKDDLIRIEATLNQIFPPRRRRGRG